MKFNATNVLKLRAPEGKNDVTIWDEAMPGFGIRFRNQGPGTYVIQYSIDGREAKMALGKVAQVTLGDAQIEAKKKFAQIAQKIDPHAERAKTLAAQGERFSSMIDAFIKELTEGRAGRRARTPHYIGQLKKSLMVYCAEFHRYGLGEITRSMVSRRLDSLEEEHGWRSSGVTQSHLSSYYNFCMRKGYDGFNPVNGTERRNSKKRTRCHTVDELKLIWQATEEPTRYNQIVRCLMLTGMRKTIFGALKRSEVNQKTNVIEVGVEIGKSKNGEEFLLPMSEPVKAMVFGRLRATNTELLFSDGDAESGPYSGWDQSKAALDDRITALNGGVAIPHWILHDFRRTFRSLGHDKCKIPDSITDVCIYHVGEAKKGLNGVYNKATYLDEKREAMKVWALYIEGLVTGIKQRSIYTPPMPVDEEEAEAA